ncbi:MULTISPECIES: ribosomal protection-like ABC-F family protein [unclassified Paenibacillus]|uniref:ribosomal protection-like ABC-F family protein n=1 Tax=unclassified Paenibacillus TaxID=185978 RepID=UPI002404B656|nr:MULTISPECIES: ABC-F family ATP-binding cassette domain-containing protein [unclassified Paenibacillus]MDF9843525.1 ATP-binding cassette subfamily F protein 3 [Paenibacillus sp. PastF-2]MDF9850113.1 ATP-binding cassette subfamily F protein 3 [Paenibacillus sp. PastM-2]MDF9857145.1 ATP-binding cassette subfamily F protein 3 [Paenibacillus sp. PastF-1]MDH6482416.1 ATP-binding cassette subfamily F protein 3 [Paenibacillus sp. PastH-2]MDH6509246.1 ATP-binding cassette subfamily F protein 3 [Paen
MIISCQNVQKYHGAQLVLKGITFDIRQGEKIGLIGRNGCGKTTLFRLLSGEEHPDQGQISIRRGSIVGLLAQIQEAETRDTVYTVLQRSFAEPLAWQSRLRELEQQMSGLDAGTDEAAWNRLLKEYGVLQEKFEAAGGYEIDASIQRVASGLGIDASQFDREFASLSGGEKTKVGLAELLLRRPDVLLLDEPTNHLDMGAIEWLEQYLLAYEGTVLAISHDRYFLDAVVKKVVEIEDGEAITYHTNYSGYQVEKEARLLQQFADYQEQQKKIKQMQESIKRLIEWGNRSNPPNPSFHRRAASMQKALDRMVKIKRPILERKAMDLQLQQEDRTGNQAVILDRISKSYGSRTLFTGASDILRYGETAALIGGNGAGKSTLLRMILGQETPDSGSCTLGSRAAVGYLAQEAVPEDGKLSVLRYFREEAGMEEGEARGQLARFLFYGSDVFKTIANLSGGEWTRLRFAVLMHRRPNLLILDEPTNHLDIDSREALEEALEEFPGTVLAVSHDRYFINRCFGKLWAIEYGRFHAFNGNYEYYKEKQAQAEQAAAASGVPAGNGGLPAGKGGLQHKAPSPANGTASSRKQRTAAAWEQEIAAAEERLGLIDAEMLKPGIASDAVKLAELQLTRDTAQAELDELYAAWMNEAEQ